MPGIDLLVTFPPKRSLWRGNGNFFDVCFVRPPILITIRCEIGKAYNQLHGWTPVLSEENEKIAFRPKRGIHVSCIKRKAVVVIETAMIAAPYFRFWPVKYECERCFTRNDGTTSV